MSVWNDIAPRETESLRLRSELMMAIERRIAADGLSQATAAEALGLTAPRVGELLRGRLSKFALDDLAGMAYKLGIRLRVEP
ncbi:helix-turn-helix domain-containing protein [Mycobacteroides abscessus]|uniref:helix-turn-helix domain-containing protein n=1 Tax=Mycobacteroides abscessus TaxID=36809 RepID=UPI000E68244E|nr:XRE family transcriptional regulator [Mycobacteroides abscessus]RIS37552.1 XRE family transcriptional regulator [Mycobacteroides abscessus]RIS70067.1 XRE family transcriptional regulator [Mycobacteroides abscessus]